MKVKSGAEEIMAKRDWDQVSVSQERLGVLTGWPPIWKNLENP